MGFLANGDVGLGPPPPPGRADRPARSRELGRINFMRVEELRQAQALQFLSDRRFASRVGWVGG